MKGFMETYGLRLYRDGDIQEAKSILDGFREIDAAAAEADKTDGK